MAKPIPHRPIWKIAYDIHTAYEPRRRYYLAMRWLERMRWLYDLGDTCEGYTAREIIEGFLGTCFGFTGSRARALKAELREILNES